ncbi:MAG TPA: hypothetical protein VJP78_14440 [Thermoleophilia bacterium]|nr:hypothetical protein [Thermoleophilia bacterium]
MGNSRRAPRKFVDHWKNRRKKLRLECRECEVICERVVSPWHCLKDSCPYIYVFKDADTAYFGCLHKVFAPELDLSAFSGASGEGRASRDPYGFLRTTRSPLPECRIAIEQAYASVSGRTSCCNPTFFNHPASPEEERIRMFVNNLPDADVAPPEN